MLYTPCTVLFSQCRKRLTPSPPCIVTCLSNQQQSCEWRQIPHYEYLEVFADQIGKGWGGKSSSGRSKSLAAALSQFRASQTYHPVTALSKDSHIQQSYVKGYSTSVNLLWQNKLGVFMHQLARTPHRDPGATSASFRLIQSHSLFIFKHSIQRADSIPYPAGEQHCFSCTLQRWHPAWSPSSCHLLARSCHQGPPLACRKCMSCREKHQADPEHAGISEA